MLLLPVENLTTNFLKSSVAVANLKTLVHCMVNTSFCNINNIPSRPGALCHFTKYQSIKIPFLYFCLDNKYFCA